MNGRNKFTFKIFLLNLSLTTDRRTVAYPSIAPASVPAYAHANIAVNKL